MVNRRSNREPEMAETPRKTSAIGGGFIHILSENSPAWLVSTIFHMLLLILMGTVVYVNTPDDSIRLNAEAVFAEKLGDQLLLDAPGLPDIKTTAEDVTRAPDDLPPVEQPLAAPSQLPEVRPEGPTATSDVAPPQIGVALSGRQEGSARRKDLLGQYGGSELTETAVNKGLEWLAKNQQRSGSWSLSGPYAGGVPRDFDNEAAATAMALLAFQGAGNTHLDGRHKMNVARGWKWLLRQQDADGCFFHGGGFNHRFYTQGQCGIAVCELYGMSRDAKYKAPAQRAVEYLVRCQSPLGGWRYTPNVDSDVSVTGWVVMALQSARMAGLEVPYECFQKVVRYLDSVAQYDGARYPYQLNGDVRLSMTAEALLMREYLGWSRDDPRLVAGLNWITSSENLVNFKSDQPGRNAYFWYYATQAAHHVGGDVWQRWNNAMREELPRQQTARGREAGSWDALKPIEDQWANHGGRLYVTCLSIYMLEVYYRHLPIYSSVYAPGAETKPIQPEEKPAEK